MASLQDSAASRPGSGVTSPSQRMPSRSRTQSISSDRPSTVAHSLMSAPLSVSPDPAFIAASAASQIVTNDHDSHAESWYDEHGIEPSSETATVSPAALQLVNNFLDQLLFNFLSVARSTTLSALRPAVSDVLKPKLAKDAINQADEELREYLGGDDEDSIQSLGRGTASPTDWDLELAWKRTRLRCMVYSSLGDMEEEDEDYYMEQGHLGAGLDDRFSEAVSPAVAIFLTSILEFMGEQALIVAGQAAYHRMRLKYEKELKEGTRSPTGVADRIVVEELDMERVALDRTLGRLWRSWKKKIRSPGISSMDRLARSYSRDSLRSAAGHLRSPSSAAELAVPATVPEPDAESEPRGLDVQKQREDPPEPLEEYLIAASIPLPLGPNDIAEIEVPGLALHGDDEAENEGPEDETGRPRPKSLINPAPTEAPGIPSASGPALSRPDAHRKRSSSLPAPRRAHFLAPAATSADEQSVERSAAEPPEAQPESTRTTPGALAAATDVSRPSLEAGSGPGHSGDATEGEDGRDDDGGDDDEVSIEEPRIVRSSRVSILGRSPSTASSEQGRPAAINTNLPARTPSIHSARLIDVTGPRSPAVGSRRNSVAVSESARHSSPPRSGRTVTPPVVDDRPAAQPLDGASASSRLAAVNGSRSGLAASVPISEAEEAVNKHSPPSPTSDAAPGAQAGTSLPDASQTVSRGRSSSGEAASHPVDSAPGRHAAKVAVLPATSSPASTASTMSGTFFIESMPVLPEGREVQEVPRVDGQRYRSSPVPQAPAVPERNVGRQALANTSALRQPASVGQAPVERAPRPSSPSQGPSSRPGESSSTGRPRQQGSPASTKLKPVRASEEGAQARIDVVRDFEELIQSDQTIQYTLTPESMRDQSLSARPIVSGSPVVSVKTRKSEEARQNGSRSRSSSVSRNDSKVPASAPRLSGSVPHAALEAQSNRSFPIAAGKHGGVVPRSIPPMPSKSRDAGGPRARDARLPRESLAEFAEFIRSTGPTGSSAVSASDSASPRKLRDTGSVSNVSLETGRTFTTSNPNRPRLQARSAAVDSKDDNSDLIDFIRRGPPSAAGHPRIPRAVAPFRTTMDSDQMSSAVGGRAVDAQLRDLDFRSSRTSTNATESSVPPSIQSSVNSHSALLAKSKPMAYTSGEGGSMPMPERKTRRIRDPYAIDLSDEELEDVDGLAAPSTKNKPQAQEESLIDFLNNYPPPPEPTAPQPFDLGQTRISSRPKKKASAPSLMARLTRRDSTQSGSSASYRPSSPKVPEARSLSSRASGGRGGHIPIQLNIPGGVDPYTLPNRTSSRVAATLGRAPAPVAGRVAMKKFEPRDPISVPSRGTSDLADFLKNSGPPPGSTSPPTQFGRPADREEPSGVSKMFTRRKKQSIS